MNTNDVRSLCDRLAEAVASFGTGTIISATIYDNQVKVHLRDGDFVRIFAKRAVERKQLKSCDNREQLSTKFHGCEVFCVRDAVWNSSLQLPPASD